MLFKLMAAKEAYVTPYIESFKKDIEGATAIEYGLIAGGIAVAIMAIVFTFGGDLKTMFTNVDTKLKSAGS